MPLKQKNNLKLKSKLNKYALLTVILFFGYNQTYAQSTQRDSLEKRIENYRSKHDFSPKDSLYIDLLNKLGSEMRYFKSDSLLLISQEAFKFSKEANNDYGQCKSLVGLGNYYTDEGNYDQAITHYHEAFVKAKLIDDKDLILDVQNKIAGAYDFKGNYAEALSRYLEGIELATQIGSDLMLSIFNENIANLYANQKNYKQAIHFYKIVKRINDKIGNDIYSAETMSNIASVYADMGELEYAMFNVNSSITTFEKHKIMDWLAYAYEVKGKTYLKEGDNKWALFFYKQSEMIHENLEDDRGETSLLNGMAEALLGLHKDSLSEQYALKAFELSKKIKFHEETQRSANTLFK